MRISDWSSDVCSSDLVPVRGGDDLVVAGPREQLQELLGGRRLLLLGSGVGEDLGAVEQRAGDPLGRPLGRVAGTAVAARQVAGLEGLDEVSELPLVGQECVITCSSRWSLYYYN